MAYNKAFSRVNWQNEPSVATPINETNLNKGDSALDTIDDRVVAMDSRLTNLEGYEPTVLAYAQRAETGAEASEGYAIGKHGGTDVPSTDPAYHNNSLYYSQQAASSATGAATSEDNAEAWAVGQKNGSDVPSTDPTYQNNAKHYAQQSSNSATTSDGRAEDSEAWAVGQRDGTDVGSSDPAYHNNSKFYSEQSESFVEDSEAWANGQRGGTDVPSTDPSYENNSYYHSQQSASSATASAASATESQSYAKGGTNTRTGENTDNALYYKNQASSSASSSADSATLSKSWAVGGTSTRTGEDTNNSSYYAGLSDDRAEDSEAYALGTRGGQAIVDTTDPAYHNNSKYYSDESADSATDSANSATASSNSAAAAATSKSDSEAYAVETRNGQQITDTTDPAYHNSAKFWAGQAQQAAGGGVISFNGRSGTVEPQSGDYDKSMVGLGNVDNTADLNKPISAAAQTALDAKAPKSDIAPSETSPTTHAYKLGDMFYYNGTLYKAKTAIAVGDTLTVDTNIETTSVSATSGGHTIVDESGVSLSQRSKLKFTGGVTVTDNSTNDTTVVNIEGEQIQVDTLPTASADELGNVYQYLGTTTSDYTHGYFYECVYENSTYKWKNCRVQDSILYFTPPTVTVGTYTYNGNEQGPTIVWDDPADAYKCVVTNATKTDVGSYTLTIALKNTDYMSWDDNTNAPKTYEWSIAKVTLTVPTVSGSFTYDGTSKTATITGFDNSTMTKSGDTATNVGTHTVTFGLVDSSNYQWNTTPATGTWSIVVPTGSTVTPINDIQTWLHCIGQSNSYTTISQVLSNTSLLSSLISSSNAVDYMVRSTNWSSSVCGNSTAMSYIGLNNYCSNTLLADSTWRTAICNSTYFESVLNVKIPTMTSNTTPSGECSAGKENATAYKAFDKNTSTRWYCTYSSYIQYKFPNAVKLYKWTQQGNQDTPILNPTKIVLMGSNDGTNFTSLQTQDNIPQTMDKFTYNIAPSIAYKYYRLDCTERSTIGSVYTQLCEVQLYGR